MINIEDTVTVQAQHLLPGQRVVVSLKREISSPLVRFRPSLKMWHVIESVVTVDGETTVSFVHGYNNYVKNNVLVLVHAEDVDPVTMHEQSQPESESHYELS